MPFLIRGALEGLGVSATVAELTQIVVGVAALAVVTVVIMRARR